MHVLTSELSDSSHIGYDRLLMSSLLLLTVVPAVEIFCLQACRSVREEGGQDSQDWVEQMSNT